MTASAMNGRHDLAGMLQGRAGYSYRGKSSCRERAPLGGFAPTKTLKGISQ